MGQVQHIPFFFAFPGSEAVSLPCLVVIEYHVPDVPKDITNHSLGTGPSQCSIVWP